MLDVLEEGDPAEVKRMLDAIIVRVEITNESGRLFYRLPLPGHSRPLSGTPWATPPVGRETLCGAVDFVPSRRVR